MEDIFPALCFGLNDCLVSFTTSVDPRETLMMAELDKEVSCQVIMKDVKLLMVKSEDDSAKP